MTVRNCKGNAPAHVRDGEHYIHHDTSRGSFGNPYPWEVRRKVPGGFDYINAAKTERHARMMAAVANIEAAV